MSTSHQTALASDFSADKSPIRVLKFHQRRFVVGLEWETLITPRRLLSEAKRLGRARGFEGVAIWQSDSAQAGFARKTRHPLRGSYSLILALASLLPGCCIAIVPLGKNEKGEQEYTLMGKTAQGGIHPSSDEIYPLDQVQQRVIEIQEDLRSGKAGGHIPVYGQEGEFHCVTQPLDISSLLPTQRPPSGWKLTPLTLGLSQGQLVGIGGCVLMSLILSFFYVRYQGHQVELKRVERMKALARQAEIHQQARYQTALDKLRHPWIDQPSVKQFIDVCRESIRLAPLSVAGWLQSGTVCRHDGITLSYRRQEASAMTTRHFVDEVKRRFNTPVSFNFRESGVTVFSLKHVMEPAGEEAVADINRQLIQIISLFQSMNLKMALTPMNTEEQDKKAQEAGLPVQDWTEYRFTVETEIPPQLLFTGRHYPGVRLTQVDYQIHPSDGALTYQLRGSVYGTR